MSCKKSHAVRYLQKATHQQTWSAQDCSIVSPAKDGQTFVPMVQASRKHNCWQTQDQHCCTVYLCICDWSVTKLMFMTGTYNKNANLSTYRQSALLLERGGGIRSGAESFWCVRATCCVSKLGNGEASGTNSRTLLYLTRQPPEVCCSRCSLWSFPKVASKFI